MAICEPQLDWQRLKYRTDKYRYVDMEFYCNEILLGCNLHQPKEISLHFVAEKASRYIWNFITIKNHECIDMIHSLESDMTIIRVSCN